MKFRIDIQGLRGLAITFVLIYHSGVALPGGFIGVDIFFVLSGYLIASRLINEKAVHGTINLPKFYLRRVFRILPALSMLISCVLLLGLIIMSPTLGQPNLAKGSIAAMFSMYNWQLVRSDGGYFDAPSESNPILHIWSLSVEEQFYLVFPLILIFTYRASRKHLSKLPIFVWTITLSAISYFLMVMYTNEDTLGIFGFYSPITRFWEFGLGILAAQFHGGSQLQKRRHSASIFFVSFLIVLASAVIIQPSAEFPNVSVTLPLVCVFFILLLGHVGPLSVILTNRPLQILGRYSYSLYLWHWPFVVFSGYLFPSNVGAKVFATLFSFLPAVLSYHYIEKHFNDRRTHNFRNFIPIFLTPIILAGTLLVASEKGFWNKNVQSFKEAVEKDHAGRTKGCFTDTSLQNLDLNRCIWNAQAKASKIYLLGDSNSEHFSEAAIGLGITTGRPIVITGASACPFFGGVVKFRTMSDAWNSRCNDFNSENLSFLSKANPSFVIIANIDSYFYQTSEGIFGFGKNKNSISFSGIEKSRQFQDALSSTVKSLKKAGHEILLIQSTPNWVGKDEWNPVWCSTIEISFGGCTGKMPRIAALERQNSTRLVLAEIGLKLDVKIFDPWIKLCATEVCSTHTNGKPSYKDGSHISVQQSVNFSEDFEKYFQDN